MAFFVLAALEANGWTPHETSLNFNGQKAPERINMNKNCTGTYDFPSRCVTSPMDDNQAVFKSKRGAPNFSASLRFPSGKR